MNSSMSAQGSGWSVGSSGKSSWVAARRRVSSVGLGFLTRLDVDDLVLDANFAAGAFTASPLRPVLSTRASRASNRSRILLPGWFFQNGAKQTDVKDMFSR